MKKNHLNPPSVARRTKIKPPNFLMSDVWNYFTSPKKKQEEENKDLKVEWSSAETETQWELIDY